MNATKSSIRMLGAGVLSAVAASLCCITPLIAILAGSSSLATNLAWIEPARPFLIGLSVAVLGLAWYMNLRPAKSATDDCGCAATTKSSFMQSKTFLAVITVFATAAMTFPMYASSLYPKPPVKVAAPVSTPQKQVKITIAGMTCAGCEEHVNGELAKVKGVTAFSTSYARRSSLVTFDPSQTNVAAITEAVKRTGYKVMGHEDLAVNAADDN